MAARPAHGRGEALHRALAGFPERKSGVHAVVDRAKGTRAQRIKPNAGGRGVHDAAAALLVGRVGCGNGAGFGREYEWRQK